MTQTITPDQVQERLIDLIAGFGPGRDAVTRDAEFDALDVDSLDLVELAQVAEEEFGVRLESDDIQHVKTVGEAIDLVLGRIAS